MGSQAVQAARRLGGEAASRLVNALMRRLAQEPAWSTLPREPHDLLPAWWLAELARAQPNAASAVATALLQHPPLVLRWIGPVAEWQNWTEQLQAQGLRLTVLQAPPVAATGARAVIVEPPRPIESMAGYAEGWFRVQDAGAQRLSELVALAPGSQVLDACAAPGGKSLLLAEAPVEVWAADVSAPRLRRLGQDYFRVRPHLRGVVRWGAADLASGRLPDGFPMAFDGVVLDAPCTASGIVSRQPEIVWRRSPLQLQRAVGLQHQLLTALWPRLKPGGILVLVVCSIFPAEGLEVHRRFLADHADAELASDPLFLLPLPFDAPSQLAHDGFTYAFFRKQPNPGA